MATNTSINLNHKNGILIFFYILLLYLPFENYLPNTSIGLGINLLNILIILLLILITAEKDKIQKPDYRPYKKFKKIIIFFMAYTLFSALLNSSSQDGLLEAFITWKRLYFIPIIFFLAYKLLRTDKQIRICIGIMSFITLTSAIQVLRNTYDMRGVHYNDSLRYGGMFGLGGENDLAAFIAINLFWFLFWGKQADQRWKKWVMLGMAGITGLACLLCYSRGAYIALAAGLLYFSWKQNKKLLILLILMLLTIPAWAPNAVVERLNMLTQQEQLDKDASAQDRIIIWEGARGMIADHLLFGVGPYNFSRYIHAYTHLPDDSPTASHNMYVRMTAELGIPGILLFLMILWSFFKEGFMLAREAQDWKGVLASAYTASIIALGIANIFGDRFFREELTGYVWVSAAIAFKLRSKYLNFASAMQADKKIS